MLTLVWRQIDYSNNLELMGDFSDEEFMEALFQMDPNKAPGVDNLNPAFFQQY